VKVAVPKTLVTTTKGLPDKVLASLFNKVAEAGLAGYCPDDRVGWLAFDKFDNSDGELRQARLQTKTAQPGKALSRLRPPADGYRKQIGLAKPAAERPSLFGQLFVLPQVGDLAIFDLESVGGEAGEGEQAEAGQGGDDFVVFDETGQGEAELGEFGVVGPDAAHRDDADPFHRVNHEWTRMDTNGKMRSSHYPKDS